jgi:hypothetical protein
LRKSYGIKRLDLIKVDVEGAELFALRGANDLIRKHKPVIIFEWGDQSSPIYGTTSADIWSFWNDREYQLFTVTGEDCSEFGSFIESSKLQTIWNYIAIPNSSIQNFRPMLKRLAELTKAFIVGAKNPEYNVRINTGNVVLTSVYDTVTIKGQISNHSDIAWIGEHQEWLGPRVEPRQFANSYKLGIRWQDENGSYVSEDRRPLPADVLFPGESKEFIIKLHPYTMAGFLDEGKYQLMIDIIKENEFWLCDHSQETAGKGPATIQAEIGFKSR